MGIPGAACRLDLIKFHYVETLCLCAARNFSAITTGVKFRSIQTQHGNKPLYVLVSTNVRCVCGGGNSAEGSMASELLPCSSMAEIYPNRAAILNSTRRKRNSTSPRERSSRASFQKDLRTK